MTLPKNAIQSVSSSIYFANNETNGNGVINALKDAVIGKVKSCYWWRTTWLEMIEKGE
jgi:hypothetical protein